MRNGRPQTRGFTTVELLLALGILVISLTLALPAYQAQQRRVRRAEAITALTLLQQAQERRRAEQPSYTATIGSGGLDMAELTPSGAYRLATSTPSGSEASAYSVMASALERQADDLPCTRLRIDVVGGSITLRSGVNDRYANDEVANRRCWSQ
ncbi:MAG TPA: type IV pilin protein [Burkholderiaceae bacterium]|nr:type IV pilin protein [Burkholderiaceae bacterium]HMX11539.1 type IV pilin protein [Burkholderiaceae bacterium]HMZ01400.1 type IV pilin protein [Burkholderiaceae bacterium]HNB46263.1 type IV pilin protein [Burkholderiaceae bacterium]HNG80854.1 type IV pilin protein [Burkholderiaceae bacterium]